MNTLIVFAHPYEGSFNRAILKTLQAALGEAGHQVRVRDLYGQGFDPLLNAGDLATLNQGHTPERVSAEQALIGWAEALIFVYPVWWFGPPAILKGWIDRCLTPGFAFRYDEGAAEGLLTHRRALVLCTLGGTAAEYRSRGWEDLIARPMLEGVLGFCGVRNAEFRPFYEVASDTAEGRARVLHQVREIGLHW